MGARATEAGETLATSGVAVRLATAIADADLTQTQVARLLAGSEADDRQVQARRRLLLKWLAGHHLPGSEYARQLAAILGKPADYFEPEQSARYVQPRARMVTADLDAIEFVREVARRTTAVSETPKLPLTKKSIARFVPQFNEKGILLERATALEPGKRVIAEARFTQDTWNFGYWYKGMDFVPAVLQIEAVAQAGALILLTQPHNRGRICLAAAFNRVRFKRVAQLDEVLEIECEITHLAGPIAHATGIVSIKGSQELVARADVTLAVQ
jgi:3-hydroxyacyl-[acyl-carrier-protein] dehydratase